ncbi:hypothetical protein [Nocardia sp. NPDC051570]|uniref:hypothetical protein n=1 Tax=Nocardia sp. NPDC051570 TaxID=3364324 RepID=UPI003790460C
MYSVTRADVAHINDIDGLEITVPQPGCVGVLVDHPAKITLATYHIVWAVVRSEHIGARAELDRAMTELVAGEFRIIDDWGDTTVYWPDIVVLTD